MSCRMLDSFGAIIARLAMSSVNSRTPLVPFYQEWKLTWIFSFYPEPTLIRKASVSAFYPALYIHCTGEWVYSDISLVTFRWASVDSLFCELDVYNRV